MRKKIAVIALLGFVLFTGIAYARPGVQNAGPQGDRNFVDADGDGICDHYQSGQCHGCGNGNGFVDADGDGICDHCQSGYGWGHHHGNKDCRQP